MLLTATALLVGVLATEIPSTDPTIRKIHAGVNAPAKEISPGLYSHEFEHVAEDGIRTSISYLARKVKHLVHLDDDKIGLVSVTCHDGDIVEVTVTNASAPPSWTVVSSQINNATILIGADNVTCDGGGDDQDSQILHRVVERPVLVVSQNVPAGQYVYRLLAESTHFSQAFDHLHLKYYRGKRDATAAKADLLKASPTGSESKVGGEDGFSLGADVPSPTSTPRKPFAYSLPGEAFSSSADRHLNRRLLYSYSCDAAACSSGTYRSAWEYDPDPDTCCSSNYGTCDWVGSGTPRKPVCSYCNSKCKTCSGAGSDDCESCDLTSSYPYHVPGNSYGGWCKECTQNWHCASNLCESNACATCHASY